MFDGLSLKPDSMRILIEFAPNLANPLKIRWWPYYYAWWLDDFLGNFSLSNLKSLNSQLKTMRLMLYVNFAASIIALISTILVLWLFIK
jgi:hypothetical protein